MDRRFIRKIASKIYRKLKVVTGLYYFQGLKSIKNTPPLDVYPLEREAEVKYFYQLSFFCDFYQSFDAGGIYLPGSNKSKRLILCDVGYLPIKYRYDDYFSNVIKSPERALIRKAIKNGFTCREINYDEYLEQIHLINISKGSRQGRGMSDDYVGKLSPRQSIIKDLGQNVYTYGCFNENGTLAAYYMFEEFGKQILHTVKGIGHSDFLKFGIMNYLFAYSLDDLLNKYPLKDHFILYGQIDNGGGLSRFKRNVGCIKTRLVFNGNKTFFNDIKKFNSCYKLHGDTGLNFYKEYLAAGNVSQIAGAFLK